MPDRALIRVRVERDPGRSLGRVENSQIGVFLGDACAAGRALLDVRLYLPRSWVADRAVVRPPVSPPMSSSRRRSDPATST